MGHGQGVSNVVGSHYFLPVVHIFTRGNNVLRDYEDYISTYLITFDLILFQVGHFQRALGEGVGVIQLSIKTGTESILLNFLNNGQWIVFCNILSNFFSNFVKKLFFPILLTNIFFNVMVIIIFLFFVCSRMVYVFIRNPMVTYMGNQRQK